MTKEEKLKELCSWLTDKSVSFKFAYFVNGVLADMLIPAYSIAVSLDEDNSENTYMAFTEAKYRAFFIRDKEPMDFIIEKMENCMREIAARRSDGIIAHIWKKITYGHLRRTRPGLHYEDFYKEFVTRIAKGENAYNVGNDLLSKYKSWNFAYFEERHKRQEAMEKEFRILKKLYAGKPELSEKWKKEKEKVKVKYSNQPKKRKRQRIRTHPVWEKVTRQNK